MNLYGRPIIETDMQIGDGNITFGNLSEYIVPLDQIPEEKRGEGMSNLGMTLAVTVGTGDEMSHTVKVTMTANQEILIGGKAVNIHDIETIFVGENGKIESFVLKDPMRPARAMQEFGEALEKTIVKNPKLATR